MEYCLSCKMKREVRNSRKWNTFDCFSFLYKNVDPIHIIHQGTFAKGTQICAINIIYDASGTAWYRARTAAGVTGYVKSSKAVPYTAGGNGYEEAVVAVSSAVMRDTYASTGTLVHEPPQRASWQRPWTLQERKAIPTW